MKVPVTVPTGTTLSTPSLKSIPKGILNLKTQLKENTVETVSIDSNTSVNKTKAFTLEELTNAWNNYVELLKSQKRDSDVLVIQHRKLKLIDSTTVEFYLDNDIQIDFLEGFKVEMLSYIRNSLQNNLIQFKPLAIQVQTEKIIYSDADKLTYLTEKYPIITEFRKKFGLENIY